VDDVIDADKALTTAATILGMPEDSIRDPKQVAAIREDRAAQQAKADQVAQDRQDAGTIKDLSVADKNAPPAAAPGQRVITPQDEASMMAQEGGMTQ
jgi:hypothetical protein